MGAIGKKGLAILAMLGVLAWAPASTVCASPVTFDQPVTIGTFGWELLAEDWGDPDFLLCGDNPCIRFFVTNLMNLLQGETELLNLLGLTGLEEFANASLAETGEPLVPLGPGDSIFRPLHWPHLTATLLFDFPAIASGGTLHIPSFQLDLAGGAVSAELPITIQPVPEPATLSLVAIGLGVAYARRKRPTPLT